jgi:hypothetical protein
MSDEPTESHGETLPWVSIVFMQGEDADWVLNHMLRFDRKVTYRGATDKTVERAFEHLKQWDFGEESEHDPSEGISWGTSDTTFEEGEYVIAYNSRLGYVSLNRRVRAK